MQGSALTCRITQKHSHSSHYLSHTAQSLSGRFRHIAFRYNISTAVLNRSLFITFAAPVWGDFYGDGYGQGLHTNAWLLNGLLVTTGSTAPTEPGKKYLQVLDNLNQILIRL